MQILVNQKPLEVPLNCTLADALQLAQVGGTFATALNQRFVPKAQHMHTALQANDQIDIIVPITGG